MPNSLDRRSFLQTAGLSPLVLMGTDWLRPSSSVEIPSVQVGLLDPASMDVDDAASRFIRHEAELFRDAVTQAAQSAGLTPEVIGISDPIAIRGKSYRKLQIAGGVPMDAFPGSPLAPVLIDAVVEKGQAATLVFFGDDANLYPVRKVLTEIKNDAPKIRYDLGPKTVVEGQVQKKVVDGVSRDVFSLIAVSGDIVPESELQEAAKLFGTTVFAPGSAMEKAFKKWSLTPWITKFTGSTRLEAEVEKPTTRKIYSVGTVQNWLNSGTAESVTIPLAVLDGKKIVPLNSDNDVEITNALATVEQKLKAQAGLSDISLVLFQREDSPIGSAQPNIVSVDSTNVMPREEPQQASVLVDLVPAVDEKTNDVVWYDKDGKPMFVTLFKKPGALYRVVGFKVDQRVNKVTDMKPVTGIDAVPTVSLVPSEAAIANFKPTTFEAAVVGKVPDAKLRKLLQLKSSEIPNWVKSLEGNKNRHPNTVYFQNTRVFGGAPLFGVIGLAADVLGLGEMVVDLPRETMPDAETPVTAKIIYVSLLDEPTKPFPVVAGFSYGIKSGNIEIGSPIIRQRTSNRLEPDKNHVVGSSNLYRVVFTLGSDRVSLINGTVPQIPEGPNKQFYQRIGQKLKDYFGIVGIDEAKKDLVFDDKKGDYADTTYNKLLTNVMSKPIKLAELINYYA